VRRLRATLALGALFVSTPSAASACSVCFSATDENRGAFLSTTIFLSLFPLALLAAFALWTRYARAPREASGDGPNSLTPPGGAGGSPLLWSAALLAAFSVLTLAAGSWQPTQAPMDRPLPEPLFEMPPFQLTNQDGAPFQSAELMGHPWVANFIFTRCTTVCPALTDRMKEFQDETAELTETRLVSFSVDPEHDTPQILKGYAERFEADAERWSFLTGSSDGVRTAVVEGFKVALGDSNSEVDPGSVLHGTRFVLLDAQSRIRGYYDVSDGDGYERLKADLAQLEEPQATPQAQESPSLPLRAGRSSSSARTGGVSRSSN
jgi:protein SCO1/2